MTTVFKKTQMLTDTPMHYCPGCTHGITHRLIAESVEELGFFGNCIAVAPVGCAVLAYDYFNCDCVEAAHGRAPAVATGIKRVHPDKLVFAYQGDGDLASIGTAEIIHAATRGENISVIFINNAIYGMTGGQMAPTTLIGQKATTAQFGRDPLTNGYPLKVCELLSNVDGVAYIERVSVTSVKNINNAKNAIKKALCIQKEKKGFSLIEVLSTCPTNWKMSPNDAMKWVDENMTKQFPPGVFKDTYAAQAEPKEVSK
ncbi:MAG: 2-oxoglutarate oxidoreductase [Clostridiales bacterium]|nr:2-oxoglutarate oxidoreductase [Clostridiales bacterium]